MAEMTPNTICSNGHPQPAGGTKFCIYCGVAVVAVASPQTSRPPDGQPNAQHTQPPNADAQQQWQQQQYQYQQQQYQQYYQQQQLISKPLCTTCGGNGQGLADSAVFCKECRWLRPLVPGYAIDNSTFAWAADAKAMAALKAIKPLNAAAKSVSEKVGRRWVEVSFNGIALGEKQLPQIFAQAVRAARLLGMSHLPDIYLSGDRPWECLTFGSDKDSFIVIGSAVAGNFQGVDLLYLLAREMGHCKAGHALWKTVIRFFLGEQTHTKGFMSGGIFNALLSPTALVTGAVEMPLLAWARQAEITADRAGLIAIGSEHIARRTLLTLSLRSSLMFRQINIGEWLQQEMEDDSQMLRLSELTTSSTPYLRPRLKLLTQYAKSPEFLTTVERIKDLLSQISPQTPPSPKQDQNADIVGSKPSAAAAQTLPTDKPADPIRVKCSACGVAMRISRTAMDGKLKLSVKCPNAKCGKITVITKKQKAAAINAVTQHIREENQDYAE